MPPPLFSVADMRVADRHVVRKAAMLVGLGNYSHPTPRHSIGQYCLSPLIHRAEAHDAALRAEVARRVARLSPDAQTFELPVPAATEPFRPVAASKGWLARVSVLLDAAPPKGDAARRSPHFRMHAYPYVLYDLVLYIPRMLMNVNGKGVAAARALYPELAVSDTLLVHDELQRAFGKVSFKHGGSAAGHNGVKSVQHHLGNDVPRIRIGIDRPPDGNVSAYVLGPMPPDWLETCAHGDVLERLWSTLQTWCLSRT